MKITLLIKGILIGIAKIIPGFSGAVLMISFNLYDKAIDAITNFFSNPKRNFSFLLFLSIGILLGIVLFSKVILFLLTKNYLYTSIFLIGLIAGGIPKIYKNTKFSKEYKYTLIALAIIFCLSLISPNKNYSLKNTNQDLIMFFISGFLEAIGTVVPGISSTALLMSLGTYNYYIKILGSILNFTILKSNLYFILPFSIGLFLGIILLTILIDKLLKKYPEKTFSSILGIVMATVLNLIIKLLPMIKNSSSIITVLFLFSLGIIISLCLK